MPDIKIDMQPTDATVLYMQYIFSIADQSIGMTFEQFKLKLKFEEYLND